MVLIVSEHNGYLINVALITSLFSLLLCHFLLLSFFYLCYCHFFSLTVKVLAAQPRLTLCDPMDCNSPGSSVLGILQASTVEEGCHVFLQGIFLTQGLSHKGSPISFKMSLNNYSNLCSLRKLLKPVEKEVTKF